MKFYFILLFIFMQNIFFAQETTLDQAFLKLPTLPKKTTLLTLNDKYQFKMNTWQKIDSVHWLNYFAVENNKIWTGQKVASIRALGYWGLSESSIAYLFAYDIVNDDGKIIPSVFISSYNATTGIKGIDKPPPLLV
jgi:hypothetical protein